MSIKDIGSHPPYYHPHVNFDSFPWIALEECNSLLRESNWSIKSPEDNNTCSSLGANIVSKTWNSVVVDVNQKKLWSVNWTREHHDLQYCCVEAHSPADKVLPPCHIRDKVYRNYPSSLLQKNIILHTWSSRYAQFLALACGIEVLGSKVPFIWPRFPMIRLRYPYVFLSFDLTCFHWG